MVQWSLLQNPFKYMCMWHQDLNGLVESLGRWKAWFTPDKPHISQSNVPSVLTLIVTDCWIGFVSMCFENLLWLVFSVSIVGHLCECLRLGVFCGSH